MHSLFPFFRSFFHFFFKLQFFLLFFHLSPFYTFIFFPFHSSARISFLSVSVCISPSTFPHFFISSLSFLPLLPEYSSFCILLFLPLFPSCFFLQNPSCISSSAILHILLFPLLPISHSPLYPLVFLPLYPASLSLSGSLLSLFYCPLFSSPPFYYPPSSSYPFILIPLSLLPPLIPLFPPRFAPPSDRRRGVTGASAQVIKGRVKTGSRGRSGRAARAAAGVPSARGRVGADAGVAPPARCC